MEHISRAIYDKHNQYHIEWAKSGSIPFENQYKTKMPPFTTPIQHSIGSSGQGNQARKQQQQKEKKKSNYLYLLMI